MRFLALTVLALSATASDFHYGLDLYAFGVSHHSNRDYSWKEINPGAGLAPYFAFNDHVEAFVMSGIYQNSMGSGTTLELLGIRLVNDYKDFQYGVTLGYGIMTGYADNPVRAMGGVFVGWRWVTLEASYRPTTDGTVDVPATAVVCGWLRFRVIDF